MGQAEGVHLYLYYTLHGRINPRLLTQHVFN